MARTPVQILDYQLSNPRISLIQKITLINQVRDLLFQAELDVITEQARLEQQQQLHFCPHCNSAHVNRFGRRNGRQRYVCAECGKTFTEYENRSMITTSKLDRGKWMRFIDCFVDGLTIRKCAANCKVSIPTAYFMRIRIQELLSQNLPDWVLKSGEEMQVDETYFYESFSGNHRGKFVLPRPAYTHGRKVLKDSKGALKRQGLDSANHIFVITGIDESRRIFLKIGGRGHLAAKECEEILASRIERGCAIVTDDNPTYIGVLRNLGVNHSSYIASESHAELNITNSLHSHLKGFMKPKRGVSTKRLALYLAEFAWRWQFCKSDEATRDTSERIVRQIAISDFQTRIKDMREAGFPLIDWWDSEEGIKEAKRYEFAKIQHGINKARKEAVGDPELEAVVNERQETLIALAAEHGIKISDDAIVRERPEHKVPPHLTMHMLRRNKTA